MKHSEYLSECDVVRVKDICIKIPGTADAVKGVTGYFRGIAVNDKKEQAENLTHEVA